ncbi:MAG TPA: carboxymuconolactone decarboxylase family protein [Solirubrobacteraceae bacterium]|nr:carboxymuconolactone decarboxylase family protein [Solirubrobacteraceae bacterium]
MARLPQLDPAQAEEPVRTALARLPQLAIFSTVANAQGSFVNWLRFGGDCLDPELFDPVLRELAILRVARLTPGAEYEWAQHVPILLAVGGEREQVAALAGDELEAAALGEDGRLVVRFTSQVVLDATPDESTFAAMRERFSTAEIVQLLLVIGQYMMVGRVMATAQLEVDAVLGEEVLAGIERSGHARRAGG